MSQVRFAIFSQHHVDGLDLALSPLQYMLKTFSEAQEQEHRSHLGRFGISGSLALQPMYTLSGGQKNRVALAKVLLTVIAFICTQPCYLEDYRFLLQTMACLFFFCFNMLYQQNSKVDGWSIVDHLDQTACLVVG